MIHCLLSESKVQIKSAWFSSNFNFFIYISLSVFQYVLYCTVLYCKVLFHTVLYCTVLYCSNIYFNSCFLLSRFLLTITYRDFIRFEIKERRKYHFKIYLEGRFLEWNKSLHYFSLKSDVMNDFWTDISRIKQIWIFLVKYILSIGKMLRILVLVYWRN